MSIGPAPKDASEGIRVADKIEMTARKTVKEFFVEPAHYIFYSALTLGIIVTLFGKKLDWEFLFLLCVSGVLNFYFKDKVEITGKEI